MTAHLDPLDSNLQEAVNNQVISVEQAWSLQTLLESSDPSETFVPAPTEWMPWLARMEFWQMPVFNELPL